MKEFPENNKLLAGDICKRYKSGVPPAPKPEKKVEEGLSFDKFRLVFKYYFRVSDESVEKVMCEM